MSRIVLTTIGSLGDLHPKIAIALALRKRGHAIAFATHKEYQSKIEALGFEFHAMRPDLTAMNDPQEMAWMMLQKGTEYVIGSSTAGRSSHAGDALQPRPTRQGGMSRTSGHIADSPP